MLRKADCFPNTKLRTVPSLGATLLDMIRIWNKLQSAKKKLLSSENTVNRNLDNILFFLI